MRNICVVTGTRADYGLLHWLMREIRDDPMLELRTVVTGMHLSPLFGSTYKMIEDDGFHLDEKVEIPLDVDSRIGIARATGIAVEGFSKAFSRLDPDIVVVLGDRFEILAAAIAATISCVPLTHIHGGELTEGAFDNAFRHSITKMSQLHFAAAEEYRRRIIQMGEHPSSVFCVGAPGLDNLTRATLLSKDELENSLRFELDHPLFLVTYHPVTLERGNHAEKTLELIKALDSFPDARIIFTGVNADPNNFVIRDLIKSYSARNKERACYFISLGTSRYLSLLRYADVVIGNSSSGIIEAPALKKPTVNIGDRQKGRPMAESVIQCLEDADSIRNGIKKALGAEFQKTLPSVKNPYGEGGASAKIKKILKETDIGELSLKKKFYTL